MGRERNPGICDRSGFKRPLSQFKMQWNGLYVREKSWDPKHPQLDIPPVTDNLNLPNARPEAQDVFIDPINIGISNLYNK
jgi:hypothetical protein